MRWPVSLNCRPSRPTTFDETLPPKMRAYFEHHLNVAREASSNAVVAMPTIKGFCAMRLLKYETWRGWSRADRPGVKDANEFAQKVRNEIGDLAQNKGLRLVFDTEQGK